MALMLWERGQFGSNACSSEIRQEGGEKEGKEYITTTE